MRRVGRRQPSRRPPDHAPTNPEPSRSLPADALSSSPTVSPSRRRSWRCTAPTASPADPTAPGIEDVFFFSILTSWPHLSTNAPHNRTVELHRGKFSPILFRSTASTAQPSCPAEYLSRRGFGMFLQKILRDEIRAARMSSPRHEAHVLRHRAIGSFALYRAACRERIQRRLRIRAATSPRDRTMCVRLPLPYSDKYRAVFQELLRHPYVDLSLICSICCSHRILRAFGELPLFSGSNVVVLDQFRIARRIRAVEISILRTPHLWRSAQVPIARSRPSCCRR